MFTSLGRLLVRRWRNRLETRLTGRESCEIMLPNLDWDSCCPGRLRGVRKGPSPFIELAGVVGRELCTDIPLKVGVADGDMQVLHRLLRF